ncbi:MAG TPA: hypothetical protein VMU30_04360 [Bacteroidota bacterium]|nr:hypothetical protein [Bacteroidota bacterium]
MEDSIEDSKSRKVRTRIAIVLALLIGIFIGLIVHNTLIHPSGNSFDIKSWYPR